jgi:3-oxoacyl-[acyl-carrier protein] reductase
MPSALLTGVGRRRGIAAGIAATLAEDGWNLALSYWKPYDQRIGLAEGSGDPERLADDLRSHGRQVLLVPGDLEDPIVPARVMQDAAEQLGGLDALVMSHTESVDSGILDTTVESFDRHYAVNVRATWLLLAAFARQLPATGGCVVALTSDHTVGNLPYGVTKGGMDRLVLAAAHELVDAGVKANVINPGPIDTGWMTDEIRAAGIAQQPTGRLGTPADIANLVRFLLSERGRVDQRPVALQQRRLPEEPPSRLMCDTSTEIRMPQDRSGPTPVGNQSTARAVGDRRDLRSAAQSYGRIR